MPISIARALHDAKQHADPADRTIEVTMGDIPPVLVDSKQVAAALSEVLSNAIAATDPATGHVTIHAAHDPYSSRVALTITDNGCGMDQETVKRASIRFSAPRPPDDGADWVCPKRCDGWNPAVVRCGWKAARTREPEH